MQQQEYTQAEEKYQGSLSDYLYKMLDAAYRWYILEQQLQALEEARYHQYMDALEEHQRATQ